MGKTRIVLEPHIKDKARWWSREDLLLIILIGALFFLPGLGQICLFDRDEPRFAEAAREMLRSGDYIVPHFNGDLRPDKPPLVYWLMTVSYRLVGDNELGARLPSAFFGIMTLIAVYFIAGFRFGRITGIVAALMLGSCSLFIVESRLATADATMIFFNTVALGCAWRAWEVGTAGGKNDAAAPVQRITPRAQYLVHRPGADILDQGAASHLFAPLSWWTPRLFWVALALGTLAKGVPLLFVFLPMIVLSIATGALTAEWKKWKSQSGMERIYHLPSFVAACIYRGNWGWWRQLRPATGFPMLVALVGWWVLSAGMQTDWEIMRQMIGHHVLARSTQGLEGHKQWPGFYITVVWGTFMPWSVLLIPMVYFTLRRLRGRTPIAIDPKPYQFLVVWVVPAWIVYECLGTKLPHYPLPLFVALIILCADMLVQSWNRLTDVLDAKWFRAMGWAWLLVWMGIAAAGLTYLHIFLPAYFWLAMPMALALVALGVSGLLTWNRPIIWLFMTVLGYATAWMLGNTLLLPNIRELRISLDAADVLHDYYKHGYVVGASGYEEPSLVFYVGQWMPKLPDQLHVLNLGGEGPGYNALVALHLADVFGQLGHSEKMCMVMDEATFKALGPRGKELEVARFRRMPSLRLNQKDFLNPPPTYVYVIANQTLTTRPASAPGTNP